MGAQRVNRITNWRSVRAQYFSDSDQQAQPKSPPNVMINPWKIESDGFSFKSKEMAVVSANTKRSRTFTGQIKMTTVGNPRNFWTRQFLFRIAIIMFVAADIALAAVFITSII